MKKALQIAKGVFTWLLVIASVAMMVFTFVSVNTFDRNNRDIFGFKAYTVRSDSMKSVNGDESKGYFKAGDLILVKETDPKSIKAGDIISYTSTNTENFGETVTHMVKETATDVEGNPGFITYGTSTGAQDENVVTYPYVLGKYVSKVPGVGTFFTFLKTTPGYIVCIFLPFLLLIVMQGISSVRLFKKYKAEQMAELEAEREKERAALDAERAEMAAERKRQEEMMQKLMAMQAAMQGDTAAADKPEGEPAAEQEPSAPASAETSEAESLGEAEPTADPNPDDEDGEKPEDIKL